MSEHYQWMTQDAPFRRTEPVHDDILHVLEEQGEQDKYDVVIQVDWDPRTEFEDVGGYVYYKKRLSEKTECTVTEKADEVDVEAGYASTFEYVGIRYDLRLVEWTTGLMRRLCGDKSVFWPALHENGEPTIAIINGGKTIIFVSSCDKEAIAEVGEILAHIGAVFSGAEYAPFLKFGGRERNWSILHISFAAEPLVERVEQDEPMVAEQSVEE